MVERQTASVFHLFHERLDLASPTLVEQVVLGREHASAQQRQHQ